MALHAHAHYGIVIDTQILVPERYETLESHARDLAQKFADIEEWHAARPPLRNINDQ